MPRADKATFIQEMLSELQLRQQREQTPEPNSKEWWRQVAQGLGVKAHELENALAALSESKANSNEHTEFLSLTTLDELKNDYLKGWGDRDSDKHIIEFVEWVKQDVRARISRTQHNNP